MLNNTLIAQRVSTTFRSYLNNCFYLLMYIFEELLLIKRTENITSRTDHGLPD